MSQLSKKTLKYITAINFKLNPMGKGESTRSMRLLLSTLPTKAPLGQSSFPQASIATTSQDADQNISVTYSDKKSVSIVPEGLDIRSLIRKIEEPARALRAKEEGV